MTEDKFCLEETSQSSSSTSSTKLRKKRKWDQPAESLVSCGAVLPGILPMSTVGCTGVSLPGAFSSSCVPSTSLLNVGYVSVQASVVQLQAAALVQKLNQPKIQEDLIIAREIVINDADPAMRYKLTKRQTQEEIQKCTGAVVITRGKYRPPSAAPDGEKPLYLHISAGAHLKETAERILAVDRAAAMVEDMLKQVPQLLSTCIYLGFDADPSLNITARIRGPNDQYINHIINETGATIVLRGRGSGYLGNTLGEDEQQPLHLLLTSNNQKSLEDAKLLAENLMDTISRECGANRVSSCKVYGAVPPPQQLLVGVQSSRTDSIVSSVASMASSAGNLAPGVSVPSLVAPVGPSAFSYAQVGQPGALLPPVHAQANGLPYSQPVSTACTSYSAYAGIYPQVAPLQQVALALRQSGSVSSTIATATSATSGTPKGTSESEKRPQQKRKFQEKFAVSKQESNLQETCRSPITEKKNDAALPPVSLKSLLPPPAPRSSSERSSDSRSMPPPPPPPTSMPPPPPPPKSMPSPPTSTRNMHPPPPPPKFGSSVSNSKGNSRDNTSNSPAVPDTLVKLMEYGDDDDDGDDVEGSESEFLKNDTNGGTSSKPFWAV